MQKKLEQELDKDYDKLIRGDFYFPNLNVAVASAFRLDKEIREDGEPPYRNPSTGMYKLVLSMASKGDGVGFVDGFDWLARYQ
jgi:hypothetical protein